MKPQLRTNQADLNSFYETYTKLGEISNRMKAVSSGKYLEGSLSSIASQAFALKPSRIVKQQDANPSNQEPLQRENINFAAVLEAADEDTHRIGKKKKALPQITA